MQDATVGGDFRLTTGETVEFTGKGYVYGEAAFDLTI